MRFHELKAKAAALGYEVTTERQVWFIPPANFWRHLRSIPSSKIRVRDEEVELWILECLKAIYGLVDGPILFQLSLLWFLTKDLGLVKSVHDHTFLTWEQSWKLCSIVLVHVDDLLVFATKAFMVWLSERLTKRFGKLKESYPPLTFTGIVHEMVAPDHLFCHQLPYLSKLRPIALDKKRSTQDGASLNDLEHFQFRSNVCSLLWLTLTRQDLIADIVILQQKMVTPQVKDIKLCNKILKKAVELKTMNGLHFRRLCPPLKLLNINDASHVSGSSLYAQEAKMVLLCEDRGSPRQTEE